ncbi:uncharacterized protein LOC141816106 [Curcuma longa]|uniref:uncharacterized protein LOC141816106 n=1 Tax=Curcuma longa TaxID=136217 RepID=UPI003D9DE377
MPRDVSCYVKLLRSLSQPAFAGGRSSPSSDVGVGSRQRSSSSYFRLPSDRILHLSVLRLDGSSFDVRVARTASVRDLKDAVEDLFRELHDPEDGKGSISWSHVWGHFCLCYKEHKLTEDKTRLKNFRINDGDQLHFMRHLSLNQGSNKRKSSNAKAELDRQRMSPTGSKVQGEDCEGVGSSPLVDKSNQSFGRIGSVELKLRRLCLFRGRFRYSKLRTTQVTKV